LSNGLGWLYENGIGVSKDKNEAIRWYKLAADQNHKQAQFNLGLFFLKDETMNDNYQSAIKWLSLAAKQGVSEAQYNLGTIYFDGLGVVQNFKKAFDNYLMSAENGFVMSQHKLSIMFLNGWGIEKDKIKAFMWVNIAASLNHEKSIEHRDEFLQSLSSKEIERGQDLSLACFEKMLKNC